VGPLFEAIFSDEPGLARPLRKALKTDSIVAWGAESLLYASLAHHGWPVVASKAGPSARPVLWNAQGTHDPIAWVALLSDAALAWFPDAAGPADPFGDAPELSHAFAGLVTWADWLASDARLFPYSEDGEGDRMPRARALAREALKSTGIDSNAARQALGGGFSFERAFPGRSPRPAQRTVIGLERQERGSLVILEAETGSGKTEGALAHFFSLFSRGDVDGLYFALPTRTASTQIHERVREAVAQTWSASERPPVTLAVPGYIKVDDLEATRGEQRLAPFQALWPDDMTDRIRWRAWSAESSKRYLASAIAVGTVDQVLLSALATKHAHLRATTLLRHLLVVDEVHASDTYMTGLLEEVISRHLAAGGHALLMSATLGGAARARLLTGSPRPPGLAGCLRVPYPAVTSTSAERRDPFRVHAVEGATASPLGGSPRSKTVTAELSPDGEDYAATGLRAAAAARAGARVIVLRNKVADAVRTQRALERILGADSDLLFRCGGVPAPHHSRFTREDRGALDRALEQAFGRERQGPGRVVVATQTIQQSLDLDADLLISDLCPMDVLLQRIGRLHRHDRLGEGARPPGYVEARVVVLTPKEDLGTLIGPKGTARGALGLGSVYPDLRIIEATRRALLERPRLEIPTMNRWAVEMTTHPEALRSLVEQLGDPWGQHEGVCLGRGLAQAGLADLACFRWSEPYGDRGFDPAQEEAASTRLGASDRMALFSTPFQTALGARSSELAIPAWLSRGAGPDAAPESIAFDMSVPRLEFRFGGDAYTYDRLGLRRSDDPAVLTEGGG